MDIQAVATQHPILFGAATFVGGWIFKHYWPGLKKNSAKWLIKKSFDWERARLKSVGATPAQIKAALEEEADVLYELATEAKTEADAEPVPAGAPDAK